MSDSRGDVQYDVCLSFAGEQRGYVEEVASGLRARHVKVFYDGYEQVSLWGKDLGEHLDQIYRQAARYCIMFVSADYARKVWTTHERRSAQARAIEEHSEYVLPVRFDDTEIPGLRPTVGYLDLRVIRPDQLVDLVVQKLGQVGLVEKTPGSTKGPIAPIDSFHPARLRPRIPDGQLTAERNGERVLAKVPLEGGGRLALELELSAARILGAELKRSLDE
ncbi:toll/interleukin-1 receptor domain-containing protein [Actinophytocola sp.]|uniref:toll/interleukin-1 receptor domain-containing protein n=1 Tax=Actinophytocola sp. TaxID=1872138 RepID=UPI00389A36F5